MHREKPAVSVICSVKNGAQTIGAVIESIRAQTLEDWEMIVVDDGSTDNTQRVVEAYAAIDSRIRLVPTDGVGRGRALNIALANAQSPFVANIDADDPCHPMRLEIQYKLLNENQQFAVLGTATSLIFGYEAPQWPQFGPQLAQRPCVKDVTRLVTRFCPLNHSSVLMRRAALERVGGYDERRSAQYDYDLWVRLVEAGYRLGRVELPLSGKRIHKAQQFERRRRLRFLLGSARVQVRAIRVLRGGPVDYFFVFGRILWGLLPNQLRMVLRKGFSLRAWHSGNRL